MSVSLPHLDYQLQFEHHMTWSYKGQFDVLNQKWTWLWFIADYTKLELSPSNSSVCMFHLGSNRHYCVDRCTWGPRRPYMSSLCPACSCTVCYCSHSSRTLHVVLGDARSTWKPFSAITPNFSLQIRTPSLVYAEQHFKCVCAGVTVVDDNHCKHVDFSNSQLIFSLYWLDNVIYWCLIKKPW